MKFTVQGYRRILLILIAVACLFVSFAYWSQPSIYYYNLSYFEEPIRTIIPKQEKLYKYTTDDVRNVKPLWTWVCRNNNCERLHASKSLKLQSLSTCSMLCGPPKLWPKPTGPFSLTSRAVPVSVDGFNLEIITSPSDDVSEHLKGAFELMKSDLNAVKRSERGRESKNNFDTRLVTVRVSIKGSSDPRLSLDTDESYKLILQASDNSTLVYISAQSFCGARHGFETLSQMVWMDPVVGSLLMVEKASIKDEPRFKYRGLLLDTARNFFPVNDILRTIDAMAANKLNTFHWHATDSQSFPLKLNSAPQLAQYGAYGPAAIYTPEDIRTVVHRARLRGIRVVIEIDAPAHVGRAWSWGPNAGFDQLAFCIEEKPWQKYCGEPPCGQLNPLNPYVYELLEKIYAEIIELTGVDDVFHLGGDEVKSACWHKYIHNRDSSNVSTTKTWLKFMKQAKQALVRANGGKSPDLVLIWSSRLTRLQRLSKLLLLGFGVQVWGTSDDLEMIDIQEFGIRTVMSNIDAWYLDCGFGSWRNKFFGHCNPYSSWQLVYTHRPWTNTSMGGTACLWSEQVGHFDLDTRLWPRSAAVGERFWSDPEGGATVDVHWRMDTQRARLVSRGIGAAPIWSEWCSHNPNSCS